MPRPAFPPTPASSTDLAGKKDGRYLNQLDSAFTLPPAALDAHRSSTSSSAGSTYRPPSPTSPASGPATTATTPAKQSLAAPSSASRRRTNGQQSTADMAGMLKQDYTLPPPPTRSRKIIQMKPRTQETQSIQNTVAKSVPSGLFTSVETASAAQAQVKGSVSGTVGGSTGATAATGGKRKQANGTTAAGRKIARKTAHSLIERRRRSKMNEEFGVLKDMIPACAGQEMHKLAILQASIEYMRYLERCVSELKASKQSHRPSSVSASHHSSSPDLPTISPPQCAPAVQDELDEAEDDHASSSSDEEMIDAVPISQETEPVTNVPSSTLTTFPLGHRHSITSINSLSPLTAATVPSTTISPALGPSPYHLSQPRNYTAYASSAPLSTLPSPAIDSQQLPASGIRPFARASFTLSSPVLDAVPDAGAVAKGVGAASPKRGGSRGRDKDDHEATAALLMLNTDRRSWSGGRGMSVKDLLSG